MDHVSRVILATGNLKDNNELKDIAEKCNVSFFSGSDDNVLQRYVLAAEEYRPEFIVRITADNPLIDVDYGTLAIEKALENKPHLSSMINLPLGTALEVIKYSSLLEAYEKSTKAYHFEHVTPYIKEHTEEFIIERYPSDLDIPFDNLRLTVDTKEDYSLVKAIFKALYHGRPFPLTETMDFLSANAGLLKLNNAITQRPMNHSAAVDVAS
jgi:spore coat polysaccharide biosynthesis protein SpsF